MSAADKTYLHDVSRKAVATLACLLIVTRGLKPAVFLMDEICELLGVDNPPKKQ